MAIGGPGRPKPRLGVLPMALALAISAFLGASLGLVWQSSGLGEDTADGEQVLTGERDGTEVAAEAAQDEGEDEEEEEGEEPPDPPSSG